MRLALLAFAVLVPPLAAQSWLTGGGDPPEAPPETEETRDLDTEPAPEVGPAETVDTTWLPRRGPHPRVPVVGGATWSLAFQPAGGTLGAALANGQLGEIPREGAPRLAPDSTLGKGRWLVVRALGSEPRPRWAIGTDRGKVRIDLPDGGSMVTRPLGGQVWGLDLDPPQRRAAMIGTLGRVLEWDLVTQEERDLAPSPPCHSDLRYSPDGTRVYVGSAHQDRDVRIRILDAGPEGRGEVGALRGHLAPARSLDVSPDGRWLASGSYDRTLRLWDLEGGSGRVLETFLEDVNGVAFSPDGQWLAAGIDDGELAVFSIPGGERLSRFQAQAGHISAVAWAPDSRTLASGGLDPRVYLWDRARLPKGR